MLICVYAYELNLGSIERRGGGGVCKCHVSCEDRQKDV